MPNLRIYIPDGMAFEKGLLRWSAKEKREERNEDTYKMDDQVLLDEDEDKVDMPYIPAQESRAPG
jgi:hypothetical protein